MARRTEVDELKLVGLLWGAAPAGTRKGLSTATVTALAVELADAEGLEAVTTRRLADLAGVTAMALYPHVGGRAELVELMLDRVAGATYEGRPLPERAPWRELVTAVAEANWASCHAHPWTTGLVAGRRVPGPGASLKYDTELRALDGIGLTDLEMEHTLTALLALVQGTAQAAIAARALQRTGQDDVGWWSRLEPALTAAVGDPTRFPTADRVASALGQTGKANDPEGAYRQGVQLLLDGIARRIGH